MYNSISDSHASVQQRGSVLVVALVLLLTLAVFAITGASIMIGSQTANIAVSESTGTVRIFQDGRVVLRIEPMDRGMKWSDFETEPPPADG